jgi:transcriptional regulator
VPTWNYIAIHAYGRPRLLELSELSQLLRDTVELYESGFISPWSMQSLPEDFVQKQMGAIVGFEIEITRLEGKLKLSQNRTVEDQRGVIEGLSQTQRTTDREVADLMACRPGR